jgi:hypothetical protein
MERKVYIQRGVWSEPRHNKADRVMSDEEVASVLVWCARISVVLWNRVLGVVLWPVAACHKATTGLILSELPHSITTSEQAVNRTR